MFYTESNRIFWLLDISKVYKQIQEDDKKYGQNRAQALVETLGGKNRSSIVAGILQSGTLLEDVYKAATTDSIGNAQKELDIQLDSIEAHIQVLKNRLQELSASVVDSEWIKNLVDFGASAVDIISKITDGLGGLNVVAGTFFGMMLQKSGNGLFDLIGDSLEGESIIDKIKSFFVKENQLEKNEDLAEWLGSFDVDEIIPKEALEEQLSSLSESAKKTIGSIRSEIEAGTITAGQAITRLSTTIGPGL